MNFELHSLITIHCKNPPLHWQEEFWEGGGIGQKELGEKIYP